MKIQCTQLTRQTKVKRVDNILAPTVLGTVRLNNWLGEVAELSKAIPSPDSSINRRLDKLQTQVEKQGKIIVWQQLYLQTIDWKEREESGNNWSARWRRSFGGSRNGGTPGKLSSHTGGWGTRSDTNRRRAILIKFDSKEMKEGTLTTSSKLKQATGDFIYIFISLSIPAV